MSEYRRIQITHFHRDDGFYIFGDNKYIGLVGMFKPDAPRMQSRPGYYSGSFLPEGRSDRWYFLGVRYRRI